MRLDRGASGCVITPLPTLRPPRFAHPTGYRRCPSGRWRGQRVERQRTYNLLNNDPALVD